MNGKDESYTEKNRTLYEINTPVILVTGLSEELNRFSQLLAMKKELEKQKYNVILLSDYSEKKEDTRICQIPMISKSNSLIDSAININHYAKQLEMTIPVDVFLVGIYSGISCFGKNIIEDFGVSAFVVSKVLPPDCIVLNSFYSEIGEDVISRISEDVESFLGEKIDVINILPLTIDLNRSEYEGKIVGINMVIDEIGEIVNSWDSRKIVFSTEYNEVNIIVEKCCNILKTYSEIEIV